MADTSAEQREELWESSRAPLGVLAFMGLLALVLYLQHLLSPRVLSWYTFPLSLLALYMGAEGVTGEREERLLRAPEGPPVSRTRWWLHRLLLQGTLTVLCAGAVGVLLVLLGALRGPTPLLLPGGALLRLALAAVPPFAVAFCVSSLCRRSLPAFLVSLVVWLVLTKVLTTPSLIYVMLAVRAGAMPSRVPLLLHVGPRAVACLALLAGSLYGFASAGPPEQSKRPLYVGGVFAALVLPVLVMLSGYAFYAGRSGAGGATAAGGSAPAAARTSALPRDIESAIMSPDGRRIAFTEGFPGYGLWLVNADGTGLRRLADEGVSGLLWLADGRRLVVCSSLEKTNMPRMLHFSPPLSGDDGAQWSVLEVDAQSPTLRPVVQSSGGGVTCRRSPDGKYLLLGTELVVADTWQSLGQVALPHFIEESSASLTWLPDGNTLYVQSEQSSGGGVTSTTTVNGVTTTTTRGGTSSFSSLPVLQRVDLATGNTGTIALPQSPPTPGVFRSDASFIVSERGGWYSLDRSSFVHDPPERQRLVLRSEQRPGPNNTSSRRTYAEAIQQRRVARTVLSRLDGSRRFPLEGLEACRDGVSPSGRYCLLNVCDGVRERDDREPWHTAVLDLSTGKVVARTDLPGLISIDDTVGSLLWSPDERWVGQVVRRPEGGSSSHELFAGSVGGRSVRLPLGNVAAGGMAFDGGIVGWTAADTFVVVEGGSRLVAVDLSGRTQVLVQGTQPPGSSHSGSSSVSVSGSGSATPALPAGATAGQIPAPPPAAAASGAPAVPYSDPTPESLLTAVLDVKPQQVSGLRPVMSATYRQPTEFSWQADVAGQSYQVTSGGPGTWGLRRTQPRGSAPGAAPDAAKTQSSASAALQRRFGQVAAGQTRTTAMPLPSGDTIINWSLGTSISGRLTVDAAGQIKSYNEHHTAPTPTALPVNEPPETPERFAAGVLNIPVSGIPAPTASGTSWWEYRIGGKVYRVEHSPLRWGLQLWSLHRPAGTVSKAAAEAAARQVANRRLRPSLAPGAGLAWEPGNIACFSFRCRESLAPSVYTGDGATAVFYPDGTLLTYEETRLLPKLTMRDIKITRAQARQIADKTIKWAQQAEGIRYRFRDMRLDMRDRMYFDRPGSPTWTVSYTPQWTAGYRAAHRSYPRYSNIRIDATTGGVTTQ